MPTHPKKQIEVIKSMVDENGIIQHRKGPRGDEPDYAHGYSMDDLARLMQVMRRFPEAFEHKYADICLNNFREAAEGRTDLLINNFKRKREERWVWVKGKENALLDVLGRSLWGLAEYSRKDILKTGNIESVLKSEEAEELFYHHLPAAENIVLDRGSPHSVAFTLLACSEVLKDIETNNNKKLRRVIDLAVPLTQQMFNWYNEHSDDKWVWPDSIITYCAARIPHAMIAAGHALDYPEAKEWGRKSLDFLISSCFEGNEEDMFVPVGNHGWYKKGWKKARYEQQTIEAGAMAEACFAAAKIFDSESYKLGGKISMSWFYGHNSQDAWMIAKNGGVRDAVTEKPDDVTGKHYNTNQGAEPILAYTLAKSHTLPKR